MCASILTGRLVWPSFSIKGPAKSMPVCVKATVGLTLGEGSSPMNCGWGLGAALLQMMH